MVEKAIDERRAEIADGMIAETHDFTASNGVHIKVSGYKVTYGLRFWKPLVYARAFVQDMIWRIKGMKEFTYQEEDGWMTITRRFNQKNRPDRIQEMGSTFILID